MNSTINKYIDYGVWHSVPDAGRDYPAWKAITKSVGHSARNFVWDFYAAKSASLDVLHIVGDDIIDYFEQND
jgi:hypothetical protein